MKVKCDLAYATFLMKRYKDQVLIRWDNGLMTVVWLTLDLSGICEE
jgi:hypothetical protein